MVCNFNSAIDDEGTREKHKDSQLVSTTFAHGIPVGNPYDVHKTALQAPGAQRLQLP